MGSMISELSVYPKYMKIGYRNELLNAVSGVSNADKKGITALILIISKKIPTSIKNIKKTIFNLTVFDIWPQNNLKIWLKDLVILT